MPNELAAAHKTGAVVIIEGKEQSAYISGGKGGKSKSFVVATEVGAVLLHVYRKMAPL